MAGDALRHPGEADRLWPNLCTQQELAAKVLLTELVEFVDDVVDDLGCRREVEHVFTILRQRGTSADQQVQIYEQSGRDLTASLAHRPSGNCNLTKCLLRDPRYPRSFFEETRRPSAYL